MGGIRNDLIIAVVLVSALAHIGGMLWAKPRVMTRVAAGVARIVRKGPIRVTHEQVRPEPAAVESFRDEPSKREAPSTGEAVAAMPSAETALPRDKVEAQVPDISAELLTAMRPVDAAIEVEPVRHAEKAASPAPKMQMDSLHSLASAPLAPRVLAMPMEVAPTAAFVAPSIAPAEVAAKPEPARIDRPEKERKQEFKPVEEIMRKVDERVVEAEKLAVKDLVDSGNSLDLAKVTSVSLASCVEGGQTYFRVSVKARDDLPAVPKDVVVLIDASGSIGKDRLASCRRHTKEILRTAMNTSDRFNIVAFRDSFEYAFKTWRRCDAASYEAGDRWIKSLAAHGRTDVFSTISSVLTLPRDPTRPLIAMVVTDGVANSGVSRTSEILSRFTALNDGLISIYMYGVKSASNRELIDLLTRGNRGESYIFDGWRWKAGEGIDGFSERFRDPLVTDLRLAFPSTCRCEVYPALLKNMYRGNSVEFVGRIAGTPREVSFSLRGIAGSVAYEGFYRLSLAGSRADVSLPDRWRAERKTDEMLRK